MNQTPCYSAFPSECYSHPRYHSIERDGLFRPSWHLVATFQEFSDENSYLSRRIMGTEIILWRHGERVRAYLNVCPHRHAAILTADTEGSSETLSCPYHGWTFNQKGNVFRIPEAQCFKGLKKEGSHRLTPIDLEMLGSLIFVRLDSNDSKSLRETMGDKFHDELATAIQRVPRLSFQRETVVQSNWKIMFETSIEDYHTPCVHADSIGNNVSLDESNVQHEINENNLGCLSCTQGAGDGIDYNAPLLTFSLFSGLHITYTRMPRPVAVLEQTHPIDAQQSFRRAWVLTYRRAADEEIRGINNFVEQTLKEDEDVMNRVHEGKKNAIGPQLLGRYEERIYHFHQYLQDLYESSIDQGISE